MIAGVCTFATMQSNILVSYCLSMMYWHSFLNLFNKTLHSQHIDTDLITKLHWCHTACQWLGHRCVLYGSDSANTAYLQHLWRSSSIRFSLTFAKLQQKHNMTLMLCFWFISYKINTKIPVRKKLNNSNITHSLANKTCSWGIQYSNVLVVVVDWFIVAHCSSVPAASLASVLLRL